jgi:hypothetical protein
LTRSLLRIVPFSWHVPPVCLIPTAFVMFCRNSCESLIVRVPDSKRIRPAAIPFSRVTDNRSSRTLPEEIAMRYGAAICESEMDRFRRDKLPPFIRKRGVSVTYHFDGMTIEGDFADGSQLCSSNPPSKTISERITPPSSTR